MVYRFLSVLLACLILLLVWVVRTFGTVNSVSMADQHASGMLTVDRVTLARGGFILISYPQSGKPPKSVLAGYLPAGRYGPFAVSHSDTIIFRPGGAYAIQAGHTALIELYENRGTVANLWGLPNYFPESVTRLPDLLGRPVQTKFIFL